MSFHEQFARCDRQSDRAVAEAQEFAREIRELSSVPPPPPSGA